MEKNTDRIQFETSFSEENSIAVEIIMRNKKIMVKQNK
jgi:hypothetical protein